MVPLERGCILGTQDKLIAISGPLFRSQFEGMLHILQMAELQRAVPGPATADLELANLSAGCARSSFSRLAYARLSTV